MIFIKLLLYMRHYFILYNRTTKYYLVMVAFEYIFVPHFSVLVNQNSPQAFMSIPIQ